jgi:hypothetical protein
VGNCRGARKLARTPHVKQKKKKKIIIVAQAQRFLYIAVNFHEDTHT